MVIGGKVENILKDNLDLILSPSRSCEHLKFLFSFFWLNIAGHCQQTFLYKKIVDDSQQCLAKKFKCSQLLEGDRIKSRLPFKIFSTLHKLWTVNYVTGKDSLEKPRGVFTASLGGFHLERPLKNCKLKFEGSFQVKYPLRILFFVLAYLPLIGFNIANLTYQLQVPKIEPVL